MFRANMEFYNTSVEFYEHNESEISDERMRFFRALAKEEKQRLDQFASHWKCAKY